MLPQHRPYSKTRAFGTLKVPLEWRGPVQPPSTASISPHSEKLHTSNTSTIPDHTVVSHVLHACLSRKKTLNTYHSNNNDGPPPPRLGGEALRLLFPTNRRGRAIPDDHPVPPSSSAKQTNTQTKVAERTIVHIPSTRYLSFTRICSSCMLNQCNYCDTVNALTPFFAPLQH